jgi:hypothetical protein
VGKSLERENESAKNGAGERQDKQEQTRRTYWANRTEREIEDDVT